MSLIRMVRCAVRTGPSRRMHALWHAGVWAVTRVINVGGGVSPVDFTVTHIPTGRSLGLRFRRMPEDTALVVMAALAEHFPGWGENARLRTGAPNQDPGEMLSELAAELGL